MNPFRWLLLIPAAALLSACGPGPLIGPAGRDALLLLGLVAAALFLWHHFHQDSARGTDRAALHLLEARYARGEIEREDYLRRREDSNRNSGLCAADGMMQALIADLENHGVARERIHWESFGAAGVSTDAQSYRISVDNAPAFTLCGEPSLLHALEEQGIDLSADCRAGTCGECRLRVRTGEVRWIGKPGLALPADQILACCTLPMSDLELGPIAAPRI